ncbi:hypothetical protein AAFN85_14895 [Mucilaginibacter sp. CAU 1740]|uniref:hypothetical protein n=1 Tax=Mucilaginibacter sp. CAU 1740 TaxID=3140365 RepID=UPI00325C076B
MKASNYLLVLGSLIAGSVQAQTITSNSHNQIKNRLMNTDPLKNTTVKKAIDAFQAGDKAAWFWLFTVDAQLFDDGNKIDFKGFSEEALGHEHFVSIDRIAQNGLHVYGRFHSDKWGDFKTYFKFVINPAGQITRLDIGQASY